MITTIGIILERLVTFRKMASFEPEAILDDIRAQWSKSKDAGAMWAIVKDVNTPFGRVFARGLRNADRPAEAIDLAMSHEASNEVPLMQSYLPGLKTIVGIAPLLGLLGTISGMIFSFKEVAQHGLSSPTQVMQGVAGSAGFDSHGDRELCDICSDLSTTTSPAFV